MLERALFNAPIYNRAMQKAPSLDEFLEVWKKESDARVGVIFASLPIKSPVISGELKRQAIEAIMRVVWFRIDTPDKEEVLWKNRDAVKKYTSDLVDKTVAENWKRVTASKCPSRYGGTSSQIARFP